MEKKLYIVDDGKNRQAYKMSESEKDNFFAKHKDSKIFDVMGKHLNPATPGKLPGSEALEISKKLNLQPNEQIKETDLSQKNQQTDTEFKSEESSSELPSKKDDSKLPSEKGNMKLFEELITKGYSQEEAMEKSGFKIQKPSSEFQIQEFAFLLLS